VTLVLCVNVPQTCILLGSMEILQAILLGVIEGLTEFLPISSTGHLIIAEKYIDFKDTAKIFTVVIQMGAMAAVVWYYRIDIWQNIKGFFAGSASARRFITNLAIAAIPAGLLGLALDKQFEAYATAKVVAAALILGALVLWLADRVPKPGAEEPKPQFGKISPRQALGIGLMQCFALIPGVSRSGAAIVGGLLGGLNRVTATAFSFYLGVPILVVAGLYKLVRGWDDLGSISGGAASIIIGVVVSFVVALLSIAWLIGYVSRHSFKVFVYYRIILGIIVLLLLV